MDWREFDAEHESVDGFVVVSGWRVYADGASRGTGCAGFGPELRSPPRDADERLRLQKLFWETRVQNLADEFTLSKIKLSQVVERGGPVEEGLARLADVKKRASRAKLKLRQAQAVERGFTPADVKRAWECHEALRQAYETSQRAFCTYENAGLSRASMHLMEALKRRFDQAKKASDEAIAAWNAFEPRQARDVVARELDERSRQERMAQLEKMEL